MKNNYWDIISLVSLIIIFIIAFPEYAGKIFENKLYTFFGVIAVFCILFLVWLKIRTRY